MSTLFGRSGRARKRARRTGDGGGGGGAPEGGMGVGGVPITQEENEVCVGGTNESSTATTTMKTASPPSPATSGAAALTFADLGLSPTLVESCRRMGFKRPTPVQRHVIPSVLNGGHNVLALASTGSGKTAAYALPILHQLSLDPYGIYGTILSPTRELARQVHEQISALGGSSLRIRCILVTGGVDQVSQSNALGHHPHLVVATPGRLAYLLRGPQPPNLRKVRFVVLDEADRLLSPGGFERDVAEILLHTRRSRRCQTLLFSATMTGSLKRVEVMASGGVGRLPLQLIKVDEHGAETETQTGRKDVEGADIDADDASACEDGGGSSESESSESIEEGSGEKVDIADRDGDDDDDDDDEAPPAPNTEATPRIPSGLRQEYIFMPSHVRDAYVVATLRTLMKDRGRKSSNPASWTSNNDNDSDDDDTNEGGDGKEKGAGRARSAIVFVSTCEKAARLEGILRTLGLDTTALHALLSQDRRDAALGKFKSYQVRILVATDVASRGLDVPDVDLVVNAELPRNAEDYVHRVGRTARAGRRGLAVSLVGERDVALVHAAESIAGRSMLKCDAVKDSDAVAVLGSVSKAARLTKMKLADIGFDELVEKRSKRRLKDRLERMKARKVAAMEVKKRVAATNRGNRG